MSDNNKKQVAVTLSMSEDLHAEMKMRALKEKTPLKIFYERILRLGIKSYAKK